MSGGAKKLLHAAAGTLAASGGVTNVGNIFSVNMHIGNDTNGTATQDIDNGIDLADKGGLVWVKNRSSGNGHVLSSSPNNMMFSNSTDANSTATVYIKAFNDNGFTTGPSSGVNYGTNNYVSFTFAKQPGFFDIQTYTGDGTSNKNISHDLDAVPGLLLVKRTDSTGDWYAQWGASNDHYYKLNSNGAQVSDGSFWGTNSFTHTQFGVGGTANTNNIDGASYVAYIFANGAEDLGSGETGCHIFGEDGDQQIATTGSFDTDGSGNATIDIGWEPQWILLKPTTVGSWVLIDSKRGMPATMPTYDDSIPGNRVLYAHSTSAESSTKGYVTINDNDGFAVGLSASKTYKYIAIRRDTKIPEAGTEVFSRLKNTNSNVDTHSAGFDPDTAWVVRQTQNANNERYFMSRLTGLDRKASLNSNGTFGTTTNAFNPTTESNKYTSIYIDDTTSISYAFKVAPKVFDHQVVFGDGSGSTAKTHEHNLGVTPEMMIVKYIDYSGSSFGKDWTVYHSGGGTGKYLSLNSNHAFYTNSGMFGTLSSTQFTLNQYLNNAATEATSVQLFATLAGVSKVGSVSHSGSTDVDCGFSSGARWVMVKRTDASGDWYVWDTARGIAGGNDPYFLVNNKDNAETTNTDYIDPLSSGFTLTSSFTAGTYIFLAFS